MALAHSPQIITNGLVLYLDAANQRSYPGSGTTWTDLSVSGLDATLVNTPTYSTDNLGNFSFEGTNQYATIPYNSILAPTAGITLEVFASASWSTITANKSIISKTQTGGWNIGLNKSASNRVDFYLRTNGAYLVPTYTRTNLASGYNHFSCTFDGQDAKLYINTVLVDTKTRSGTGPIQYSANNSLMIAAEPGSTTSPEGFYFPGTVSNTKIYNRALSADEIVQNFNALRGRYGI